MINVFLDDIRENPPGYELVKTAEQAIELLSTNRVKVLSLDYDLGTRPVTGYEVVRFMVQYQIYPQKIIIHSANPFGRMKMHRLLNKYKPFFVKIIIYPLPLF